jgi:hypothetical protein
MARRCHWGWLLRAGPAVRLVSRRLDPRQQFVLAVVFLVVLTVSFAAPLAVGLLGGAFITALGTPAGSPSIPRLVIAEVGALAVVGVAVGGTLLFVRWKRSR